MSPKKSPSFGCRQRRRTVSSAIRFKRFPRARRRRPRRLARDPRRNRLERFLGAGAVGASGLGEVGAAAPAFAAERFRAHFDQLDGIVSGGEVFRHADNEAGLALIAYADDGDDARAQLFLAVIDEAAQILRRHALHRPRKKLDLADLPRGRNGSAAPSSAPTESKTALGVGKLALQLAAFIENGGKPRNHLVGRNLEQPGRLAHALNLRVEIGPSSVVGEPSS